MNVMGSAPELPKASVESSGSYGSDYSYYSDSDSAHAKDSRFDQNQLGWYSRLAVHYVTYVF